MFSSTSLQIAAFALPFASALTINTPSGWTSGARETVTWSTTAGDPSTFTIELAFPGFNQAFGLANNVNTSAGSVVVSLPEINNNTANYMLQAVNITNDAQIFSSSSTFAIGPQVTTTSTSSGTSTGSTAGTGTASSGSSSRTATSPASGSPTSTSSTSGTTNAASAASTIQLGAMNVVHALIALSVVTITAGVPI